MTFCKAVFKSLGACTVGVVPYQALDFAFAVAELPGVSMRSVLWTAEIPLCGNPTNLG